MNEYQPDTGDQFRLSNEYLDSTFMSVAGTLIKKGNIREDNDGMPYRRTGEMTPYVFSCEIPASVIGDIFGDDLIYRPSELIYTTESRIDDALGADGITSSIYLKVFGAMQGVEIDVAYEYFMVRDEYGQVEANVEAQYKDENGKLLNRGENLEVDNNYDPMDARHWTGLSEALAASIRDMTLDDIEHLERIADYISEHK